MIAFTEGIVFMQASFLDLRRRMKDILRALDRREKVILTYRGKPRAVLTGITENGKKSANAKKASREALEQHPAFGMWADREDMKDVAAYVRNLRKSRFE